MVDLHDPQSFHNAYKWVKKRKICFIPWPGRPKNKIESYRTISLLKVYNKILPKLLCLQTTRICPHTVINSAKRTGKPIHIVFLDARVAFDLTTTEATTAMMKHLGTPDEPMKKLGAQPKESSV